MESAVETQKDVAMLESLKDKLYSGNMSAARRAAHNLSWMQENGFDILKQGLIGRTSIGTKIASAYGLRSMNGRMKKMVLEVLLEGLKSPNANTRRVCAKTALIMTKKSGGKKSAAQNSSK